MVRSLSDVITQHTISHIEKINKFENCRLFKNEKNYFINVFDVKFSISF